MFLFYLPNVRQILDDKIFLKKSHSVQYLDDVILLLSDPLWYVMDRIIL